PAGLHAVAAAPATTPPPTTTLAVTVRTIRCTAIGAVRTGLHVRGTAATTAATRTALFEPARRTTGAALPPPLLLAAAPSDTCVVRIRRSDGRHRDPHRAADVFDHRAATTTTAPRLRIGERSRGRQHRRHERALRRQHRASLAAAASPATACFRSARGCRVVLDAGGALLRLLRHA